MTNSERGEKIRNVIGTVATLVGQGQQAQPVAQPMPQPQVTVKTDYKPIIIAGAFTLLAAFIVSRRK